jgi:hypothetical protein
MMSEMIIFAPDSSASPWLTRSTPHRSAAGTPRPLSHAQLHATTRVSIQVVIVGGARLSR